LTNRDSIGIGIIGSGFARSTQIPGFRAAGARVTAIARGERAASVAREFEITFVGEDRREVVERADVDLVSIVTPPSTHLEIAITRRRARRL
jgi:predicted dehydrogenase